MKSREVREKFIDFFKRRGHVEISPSPLILENDSTTLFTSAGMQQLVPYLKGKSHPKGRKLVNSQPSIRLQDIDEVGDTSHTTFFEMLGNWSLGDYFKDEQLNWFWEFLIDELKLSPNKLYITLYAGSKDVPKDEESLKIWRKIGVPEFRIHFDKGNWWSRSGLPGNMVPGDIGGPDCEVFYDFGDPDDGHNFDTEDPRYLEIGNSVFIEYEKQEDGSLRELPQKNVDFGGGLERLTAAIDEDPDVFNTSFFSSLISEIERQVGKRYQDDPASFRIITDHIRAATFLASNGVTPSNKQHGYVMRRLIRRSTVKARRLKNGIIEPDIFTNLVSDVISSYSDLYFNVNEKEQIQGVVFDEVNKFTKTLEKGFREVEKINKINGKKAFDLYQTYGFPLEITTELFSEMGQEVNEKEFRQEFEKHQDLSRTTSSGMFKGGLADHSESTVKLHTTAHLLQAALRKVLGPHVEQKGQNITPQRLRFDFSHPEKMTQEQIEKVEDLINKQIEKNLPVSFEEKTLSEAQKEGALAFFKYSDPVKVYTIGNPKEDWFSKEVCGGPHVANTSKIGHVTITKEESAGSGVRRIYAQVDSG